MKRGSKTAIISSKSTSGANHLHSATKTFLNGNLTSKRIVVKAKDILCKTVIHYLNPRNQEALTLEAVSDIFPSIKENGVTTEGIAIEKDGKLHVLDASRRRFACLESNQDLPLWVVNSSATDQQLLKIINDSQEVKKWSYPEHGRYLLKIANIQGLNTESMKIDELAVELGIGRESLRKRIEALEVDSALRSVFIDYEGIPNGYYSDLAKLQRQLTKIKINVSEQMVVFKSKLDTLPMNGSISERQKKTLEYLKEFVNDATQNNTAPKWVEKELGSFENKRTKVRRKVNEKTRRTVYEFTRLPKELQAEIDSLIESKLNK